MASSPSDGWVDWQGSKCKSKCFAAFSLRTKNLRPCRNADFGATVDSDGVLASNLIREACGKQFSMRKYAF